MHASMYRSRFGGGGGGGGIPNGTAVAQIRNILAAMQGHRSNRGGSYHA